MKIYFTTYIHRYTAAAAAAAAAVTPITHSTSRIRSSGVKMVEIYLITYTDRYVHTTQLPPSLDRGTETRVNCAR